MDQLHILTDGAPAQIRAEIHSLFEGMSRQGGYISSVSDHFFHASIENLIAFH